MQSIFPKIFGEIAMACYNEDMDAYQCMFDDKTRYNAYMLGLGEWFYRKAHKKVEYSFNDNFGNVLVADGD